ncbi:hypothetical protein [Cohnella mopanensis]|uniref:hypothetical protein n=1 Tax=Cohnella mopanensis TaxID=2911966 RepID=UPI001EF91974|nr:hypothetical protein [Cohnella mopanensis]
MKKVCLALTILSLLVTGCSLEVKVDKQDNVLVYFAKGETWASTYTLIDAGDTLFDSLYIQHIGNRETELKPIEYVLEGNGIKSASQYPQKLQGVRSFQVSSEYNKQLIDLEDNEDKEYKLIIKQNGKTEELTLRLVGEEGNF